MKNEGLYVRPNAFHNSLIVSLELKTNAELMYNPCTVYPIIRSEGLAFSIKSVRVMLRGEWG